MRRPQHDVRANVEIRRLRTLEAKLGTAKLHVLLASWCAQPGLRLPSVSTMEPMMAAAPDKMRHAPARIDRLGCPKPVRCPAEPHKPKGVRPAPLQGLAVDTIERLRLFLSWRSLRTLSDAASAFA